MLSVGGCSGSTSGAPSPHQSEHMVVDLPLPLNSMGEKSSDPTKQELLSRIKRREPISVQTLLELLIQDQCNEASGFGNTKAKTLNPQELTSLLEVAVQLAKSQSCSS